MYYVCLLILPQAPTPFGKKNCPLSIRSFTQLIETATMSAQYWTELTQQGQAMVEGLDLLSQTRQARMFVCLSCYPKHFYSPRSRPTHSSRRPNVMPA